MKFNDEMSKQFSQREKRVIELTVMGCSTQQIAKNMELSICTIKYTLFSIYQKLGAKNKAHACFLLGLHAEI